MKKKSAACFNYVAELSYKKMNSEDQIFLEIFYVKKSSSLNRQNQTEQLSEVNNSIFSFQGSLSIRKNQHHNSVQSRILHNKYWEKLLVYPHAGSYPYEWIESDRCTYVCQTPNLGMSDHNH